MISDKTGCSGITVVVMLILGGPMVGANAAVGTVGGDEMALESGWH